MGPVGLLWAFGTVQSNRGIEWSWAKVSSHYHLDSCFTSVDVFVTMHGVGRSTGCDCLLAFSIHVQVDCSTRYREEPSSIDVGGSTARVGSVVHPRLGLLMSRCHQVLPLSPGPAPPDPCSTRDVALGFAPEPNCQLEERMPQIPRHPFGCATCSLLHTIFTNPEACALVMLAAHIRERCSPTNTQ